MNYRPLILLIPLTSMLFSCASLKRMPEAELPAGYYHLKEGPAPAVRVYAGGNRDSLKIIKMDSKLTNEDQITSEPKDLLFTKRSFDVDVMIIPFKYRPSVAAFPRQLTTEFNGNVFLGYRIDNYHASVKATPAGSSKRLRHRALTAGVFAGLGSSNITPSTTLNQTTDDYNGLILGRGISVMGGLNNITVGVGVGWDYLTDRDKDSWIYQNRPWLGLTLSVNLN